MKTLFAPLVAAALLCSSNAHAADVAIDLDIQAPGFDVIALRARLSADLGEAVAAPGQGASIHLFVTEINGKLVVGISQGSRQVTRQIELPANHAVAEETLELLLAAMTRSESIERPADVPVVLTPPPPPTLPPPVVRVVSIAPPAIVVERERTMPVAIDLLPFVGFSSATRARDTRFVSIGAVGAIQRNVYGASINGAVGVTTADVRGAQIAGAVNVIAGETDGAQIGGAVNVSGAVHGVQIAGAVNVVHGDVDGAQISGAVNVASGHVRGLQLGVVNIADESDAPIGLVNVIAKGRHHVDVWGSETGLIMGGGQLGGKYTHAILGVGVRPGPDGVRFAFGGGIGFHADVSETLGIDFDLLHHDLSAFTAAPKLVQLSQARLLFDFALTRGFRLFAGPTFNVLVSNDSTDVNPSVYGSWTVSHPGDLHVALWPGITIGSRLL